MYDSQFIIKCKAKQMQNDLPDQLKDEYLQLQTNYEEFDNRALIIKSWSAALLGGGVVFGLQFNSRAALVITIAAALTLWILEAIWKSFQYCFYPRIEEIEKWFKESQEGKIDPFQIATSWIETSATVYIVYYTIRNGERLYYKGEKHKGEKQEDWREEYWKNARIDYWQTVKSYWPLIKHPFVFIPYLPIIVLSILGFIGAS